MSSIEERDVLCSKVRDIDMQRRDKMFAARDSRRFRTPQRKKYRCSKLALGERWCRTQRFWFRSGWIIFQKLTKSKVESTPDCVN